MLGTLVNSLAIIVGGLLGLLIKGGIKKGYNDIIMQALGLSVMLVGLSTSIGELIKPGANKFLFIFSLIIGGIIGEALNIEGRLEGFANKLQNRFAAEGSGISEGFVTATLVYCVGSMAILGSLADGINKDPSILFTKSILDGVLSIVFASVMGWGVMLSALPVLLYQGAITLLSSLIKPFLTTAVMSEISITGGILVMIIGLNTLKLTKIKTGNFMPAVFVPIIYHLIFAGH